MAVQFWLNKGKDKLRLPVNPESLSYTSPFGYTETEVEGLGEITVFGRRAQRDFTISTFWPAKYNPVYCSYSGFISPASFIKKIESWRNKREPIRLVVTGKLGVNVAVTIRDFEIEAEKSGSPGDIYFTLSLKEYREPKIDKVDTSKKKKSPKSKKRPSASKKTPPKTYIVKKGDSLWAISKRVYGYGNKWRTIYNANKKTIGSNPNKLSVGMKLVIP